MSYNEFCLRSIHISCPFEDFSSESITSWLHAYPATSNFHIDLLIQLFQLLNQLLNTLKHTFNDLLIWIFVNGGWISTHAIVHVQVLETFQSVFFRTKKP